MHAFISRTAWVRPTKMDAADDAVADVELFHALESRDGRDVLVIEAVPGVQFQSGGEGGDGRGLEGIELAVVLRPLRRRWRNGRCAARLRWRPA